MMGIKKEVQLKEFFQTDNKKQKKIKNCIGVCGEFGYNNDVRVYSCIGDVVPFIPIGHF